ncbi:MAG: hypothetical protein M4D80_03250 [Myxococcota bacterium]|nr:hypothetical protein [Myxococcota bacterium]
MSLVGCVGDVDSMGPGEEPVNDPQTSNNPAGGDLAAAKKKFDDNVYPVLTMKCSGGSCHSQAGTGGSVTKFVATLAADGHKTATEYTALVGNFTSSAAPILTIIKGGTHKGVTYVTAEESKIVEWLDAEVTARNVNPNNPPPSGSETLSQATERVLSAFAGCMQLTDFQAANMANAWGNLTAQNNQQCKRCHVNGGEGFIATTDAAFMYDVLSTKKYHFLQYFTVDLTQGAAAAKVLINQASFLGVAQGQDPHREHPRFNATQNQGMTALTQFYNATMARVGQTGLCAPKPLQNQ